jgi:hypothetical protein
MPNTSQQEGVFGWFDSAWCVFEILLTKSRGTGGDGEDEDTADHQLRLVTQEKELYSTSSDGEGAPTQPLENLTQRNEDTSP